MFFSVLNTLFVFIFFSCLMHNYAISLAYTYDITGFAEKNKSYFASTFPLRDTMTLRQVFDFHRQLIMFAISEDRGT